MSSLLPDTPSEVHGRVYRRSIAPLLEEEAYSADAAVNAALADLLVPLDLTTYPTTYGPPDEDPFYSLRVAAHAVTQEELFPKLVTGGGAQSVLKTAFDAMREEGARTLGQRLSAPIQLPRRLPRDPFEVVFPASHVTALRELAEQLTSPRTIQQLFLPSSRHFLSGYATVPPAPGIKYTHADVIDGRWKLDPEAGEIIRRVGVHPSRGYAGLEGIWERWARLQKEILGTRALSRTPPLVPLDHAQPDYTYLICGGDTSDERSTTPGMAFERVVVEMDKSDMDPFALSVLDEMDDTVGWELSESTAAFASTSASTSARSSRKEGQVREGYIDAWSHTELSARDGEYEDWDDEVADGAEVAPPRWHEGDWGDAVSPSERAWFEQDEQPPSHFEAYASSPSPVKRGSSRAGEYYHAHPPSHFEAYASSASSATYDAEKYGPEAYCAEPPHPRDQYIPAEGRWYAEEQAWAQGHFDSAQHAQPNYHPIAAHPTPSTSPSRR